MAGKREIEAGAVDGKTRRAPGQRPAYVAVFAALCVSLAVVVLGAGFASADSSPLPMADSPIAELPPPSKDLPNELAREVTNLEAAEGVPLEDLSRDEALDLVSSVFNRQLQNAAGVFDELEVEKFYARNVAVIKADEQGELVAEGADEPALLVSTTPLATENQDGHKEAVDLSLESVNGELQPSNPLVDVAIPTQLDQGISLVESGINIRLADAPATRAPSIIEDSTAFYPNVAPDTDLVVAPTPDGVETLTQLRSPDAPESQVFELSLPTNAQLRASKAGGAEVIQDGRVLVVIPPPTAVDAAGRSVQVSLETSEDNMTLTASPDEDATYPILVDPLYEQPYVWMWNHSYEGMLDWRTELNAPATSVPYEFSFRNEGYVSGVGYFPGLSITTGVGTVPANSQGKWFYAVPRYWSESEKPTTFIRNFTLHRLWYKVDSGIPRPITGSPMFRFGLWNVGSEQWTSEGHRYGTEGNLTDLDHIYPAPNPQEQPGAKIAVFMLDAYEPQMQYRELLAGEASIELSDKDAPAFGSLGNPTKWVNSKADAPISFKVSDPGLGIKEIVLWHPTGAQFATKSSCTGIVSSPCPRTWNSGDAALPAVDYKPQLLPQGENWLGIEAVDPIGRRSPEEGHGTSQVRIKVDHTNPKIAPLSGTLTEQATLGTKASQYTLKYSATDGDNATPEALTPFGAVGTAPGQMQEPRGIAADASGNLWVVDRANDRVMKYASNGSFLMQFGGSGSGNGQFSDPRSIAISPNGTIWVSDVVNNSVQAFNSSGQFIRKISYSGFVDPYGVATGPGGEVWVSDMAALKLFEFTEAGAFIRTAYGSASNPSGSTDFQRPMGIATDPSGNLWLTDGWQNAVQKFSPNGKYLLRFGSEGTASGKMKVPIAIAVAPSGNVLVTEEGNDRVSVFQPNGIALRQFGTQGAGNAQFVDPKGILVGSGNTAYVVDGGNQRVARWSHADRDPQSGVASTEVKVDGNLVEPKYAPGCAAENCSITKEWTLQAKNYASGQHTVQVTATDGVGLPTSKPLTITTVKDTTGPQLTANSAFFTAPEGWLEQKSYSYTASASDTGGYGVSSLTLKIDGKAVKTTTQSCPSGGCGASISASIDMATYKGGAHPAEVIATDVGGNTTTKKWTINVDPKGNISGAEATDTLEAVEDTSPVNLIGEPEEEEEYEGPPALVLDAPSGELQATGTQVPTTIAAAPGGGIEMEGLGAGSLANVCPSQEEQEEQEEQDGEPEEPESPEASESCMTPSEQEESVDEAGQDGLVPIELAPAQTGAAATTNQIVGDVAAVAANTASGVDTIVRPLYDGSMIFKAIRDSTSPETFSWVVQLEPDQELRSIDSQHATVYYDEGYPAFGISAVPAHDATGASVPTKLTISEDKIITLHVEHQKAASEGHPFVYPIIGGAGWEGGFQTYQVEMPPPVPIAGEEEEEEEAWEELEVNLTEGLPYVRIRLSAQGPPVALAAPGGANGSLFSHRYKFSECRYQADKLPKTSNPKRREWLITIEGNCMQEKGTEDLLAAMALRGWYRYKPKKEIWTNASEEDCKKWGPYKPAMVHCEAVPRRDPHHVVLYGNYRFQPGTVVNPSFVSECDTLWAVLTIAAPHKHEREPMVTQAAEGESCDWPQR